MANALSVDVLPSGYSDSKDRVGLAFTVLNFLATVAIPLLIWYYGWRQEQAKARQAARQRLQRHVSKLSDTNAMHVISTFKQDCDDMEPPRHHAQVFRQGKTLEDPTSGIVITRQQIQEVDEARKKLQGIWDNIMDDYRAGELGGPIYSKRHSRILKRGLIYMELVEPLEAANWVRLASSNSRVASQGLYVAAASGQQQTQQQAQQRTQQQAQQQAQQPAGSVAVSVANSPLACLMRSAGSSTTQVASSTGPGSLMGPSTWHVAHPYSNGSAITMGAAVSDVPMFTEGARPRRFSWLENQKTMEVLIKMNIERKLQKPELPLLNVIDFWQKDPQLCLVGGAARMIHQHNTKAYEQLREGPSIGKAWLEDMKAHWQNVLKSAIAANSC